MHTTIHSAAPTPAQAGGESSHKWWASSGPAAGGKQRCSSATPPPRRRAPPEHMALEVPGAGCLGNPSGQVPAARAGPRGYAEAMAPGPAHPPDAEAPKHLLLLIIPPPAGPCLLEGGPQGAHALLGQGRADLQLQLRGRAEVKGGPTSGTVCPPLGRRQPMRSSSALDASPGTAGTAPAAPPGGGAAALRQEPGMALQSHCRDRPGSWMGRCRRAAMRAAAACGASHAESRRMSAIRSPCVRSPGMASSDTNPLSARTGQLARGSSSRSSGLAHNWQRAELQHAGAHMGWGAQCVQRLPHAPQGPGGSCTPRWSDATAVRRDRRQRPMRRRAGRGDSQGLTASDRPRRSAPIPRLPRAPCPPLRASPHGPAAAYRVQHGRPGRS